MVVTPHCAVARGDPAAQSKANAAAVLKSFNFFIKKYWVKFING
jgi:hypothetical protein